MPAVNKVLGTYGLRRSTYSSLVVIVSNPGLNQGQLADALAIERPNVVQIVDQLEKAKLVRRSKSPVDRRAHALKPTSKGCELQKEATEALEHFDAVLTEGLSAEDIATLHRSLKIIEDNAEKAEVRNGCEMAAKYRPHNTVCRKLADGTLRLTCNDELGRVVDRTTDWLDTWAADTPDAVFLAERSGAGWREVTYQEAWQKTRAIAAGFLGAGLKPGDPILILSGNSVDHGLLALAAQYVGIPIVPLAEQYALIPEARTQIDYAANLIKPAMVFAEDGDIFGDVLTRSVFAGTLKLVSKGSAPGALRMSDLSRATGDISEQAGEVGPDTVAKLLMTSGSTSSPKAVPTTHRMMCANQAQIAYALPFLTERPPVIVDWLPWNHVFGGSHNFNMILANGGALYIDGGKPIPALVGQTVENLRLKTGTMTFNVPVGFSMVRDELKRDSGFRRRYFEELDMLFYAGASLPQDVWSDLEDMAREVRGDMPLFTSSWGLTETAPAVLLQHQPTDRSGVIGVPLPGCEIKLIPDEDMRCEVRVKGPNIFDGYLDNSEQSANAFDEEGFFLTGDAMVFVDPNDPNQGMKFDGRISEEFKLLTGTWVRAATLRLEVLAALGDLASDVVITGADRRDIGVMIVPSATLRADESATERSGVLRVPSKEPSIRDALARIGGSSSTRIARAIVLSDPPSVATGEITAKGSLNTKKILTQRSALLVRLYEENDEEVIRT
jgi:feruloyl-CoA synthase